MKGGTFLFIALECSYDRFVVQSYKLTPPEEEDNLSVEEVFPEPSYPYKWELELTEEFADNLRQTQLKDFITDK